MNVHNYSGAAGMNVHNYSGAVGMNAHDRIQLILNPTHTIFMELIVTL